MPCGANGARRKRCRTSSTRSVSTRFTATCTTRASCRCWTFLRLTSTLLRRYLSTAPEATSTRTAARMSASPSAKPGRSRHRSSPGWPTWPPDLRQSSTTTSSPPTCCSIRPATFASRTLAFPRSSSRRQDLLWISRARAQAHTGTCRQSALTSSEPLAFLTVSTSGRSAWSSTRCCMDAAPLGTTRPRSRFCASRSSSTHGTSPFRPSPPSLRSAKISFASACDRGAATERGESRVGGWNVRMERCDWRAGLSRRRCGLVAHAPRRVRCARAEGQGSFRGPSIPLPGAFLDLATQLCGRVQPGVPRLRFPQVPCVSPGRPPGRARMHATSLYVVQIQRQARR